MKLTKQMLRSLITEVLEEAIRGYSLQKLLTFPEFEIPEGSVIEEFFDDESKFSQIVSAAQTSGELSQPIDDLFSNDPHYQEEMDQIMSAYQRGSAADEKRKKSYRGFGIES